MGQLDWAPTPLWVCWTESLLWEDQASSVPATKWFTFHKKPLWDFFTQTGELIQQIESNSKTLSSSCLSTGVHLLALFNNVTIPARKKIIFWLFGFDIFKLGLGVKNLNCKWHPTVQTHDDLMVVGFLSLKLQDFYNLCLFCHKMPSPTQLLFFVIPELI